MNIAIIGASSEIARDLILSFIKEKNIKLHLFARRPNEVNIWLNNFSIQEYCLVDDFSAFGKQEFDVVINFVGVGNPAKASSLGASIFDITLKYDELVLNYLRDKPSCRYFFLSSGAAYGTNFDSPANFSTKASIDINNLKSQDWYGVAKLHAESRHRSLSNLSIIDIRVFNYFNHKQNMEAQFFIADIVRSIRDDKVLETSSDEMMRDYIGSDDFASLVKTLFNSSKSNDVIDTYSISPVSKFELLEIMKKKFNLTYAISNKKKFLNPTGEKINYFSTNRNAEKYGYVPSKTSIMLITEEVEKYFYGKKFIK
jgi:nucleoside-diphosphate-sugar epimerase